MQARQRTCEPKEREEEAPEVEDRDEEELDAEAEESQEEPAGQVSLEPCRHCDTGEPVSPRAAHVRQGDADSSDSRI